MIELVDEGAWTWFHNPRALHHRGRHDRTYFTWSAHGIWIGAYDHRRATVDSAHLLETKHNDHNVAAVGIRADGRVLTAYSAHNGALFTRVSSDPEDVTRWREATTIRSERATYPNLFYLAGEGRWFLFYRGGPTGNWPIWFRTSSDDGDTWSDEQLLFRNGKHRPYLQVVGDGVGQIHLSLTDGHPNVVPGNSIYHLWYDEGTWRSSPGNDLGQPPFAPQDLAAVYDGTLPGYARAWCWDVAIDGAGRPVMAFATIVSSADHRYHYARLERGEWSVHEISAGGRTIDERGGEPEYSAGLAIDHDDPRGVFLAREVAAERWELERWLTEDGGNTWTHEAVTSGSPVAPFKNFRPTAVRGGGPFSVLWCAGDYMSYRDFDGGLRALVRPRPDVGGVRRLWDRLVGGRRH